MLALEVSLLINGLTPLSIYIQYIYIYIYLDVGQGGWRLGVVNLWVKGALQLLINRYG